MFVKSGQLVTIGFNYFLLRGRKNCIMYLKYSLLFTIQRKERNFKSHHMKTLGSMATPWDQQKIGIGPNVDIWLFATENFHLIVVPKVRNFSKNILPEKTSEFVINVRNLPQSFCNRSKSHWNHLISLKL